jgi:hypothetical protein
VEHHATGGCINYVPQLRSSRTSDLNWKLISCCSVPVAAIRTLKIDPSLVNVNGSGVSLGHPIAATGTRMIVTMIHEAPWASQC